MRYQRRVKICEECGVAFIGEHNAKLCPMHEREKRLGKRKDSRAYYKKKGWCYDCGKPVAEGRTRCENCLEKHRNWYNKKRA